MVDNFSDLGASPITSATSGTSTPISIQNMPGEAEKPSIGLLGQFLAGKAEQFSYPLSFLQAGASLAGMEELKEMGEFNPESAKAAIEAGEFIPTQAGAEKKLEEKTGRRFEPKGFLEKGARALGRLAPKKLLSSGVGLMRNIAKGVAATAGAGTEAGLEELGVNPIAAGFIGGGLAGFGEGLAKSSEKAMTSEALGLKQIAAKHQLRQAKFIGEKEPLVPPLLPASMKEKFITELGQTSESALKKVIEEKNPVAKMRSQGQNISEFNTELLNKASDAADKISKNISTRSVVQKINKRINEIEKAVPHPSANDEAELRILRNYRKDFVERPKEPKVQLLGPNGEPLPRPKLTYKILTGKEHLKQYRKVNEDRATAYKQPEMSGVQAAADRAYGLINHALLDTLEPKKHGYYSAALKASNKMYSETKDLEKVDKILKPFFDNLNTKTLATVLKKEKNESYLRNILGKDGLNDLNEISRYGNIAREKLEKNFSVLGKNWYEVGTKYGAPLTLMLMAPAFFESEEQPGRGKSVKNFGQLGTLALGAAYLRGAVLTNKEIRGDYINVLKAIASANEKAIGNAAINFNNSLSKNYGDINQLITGEDQLVKD